jgi:hypothetical protein
VGWKVIWPLTNSKELVSLTLIDPEVSKLTSETVKSHVEEFRALLDKNSKEEVIQAFLESHSYFFSGPLDLFGLSPLYSKIKLGSEYITDFAWFGINSLGCEWNLVEIEAPGEPLFNVKGDPSASLTHALRQVRDWQYWVHKNNDFARKLLPNVLSPMGYIYMGRHVELKAKEKQDALQRLSYDNRGQLRIHTLDRLTYSAFGVAKSLIGETGRGNWSVPMKALTHKDLADGLTTEAKKCMLTNRMKEVTERDLPKRINDRAAQYLDFG